ncbi:MAG: sulfatase, partial [Planctomycetaceae bacterium]|nr:sulfatase [Planctomycetaceae bacterium]
MADRHDAMETELRNRSAHLDLTATTRRAFLGKLGTAGVGALGLAWATGQADGGGLLPGMGDQFDLRRPHFAPTARRIIYLHMAGSPPHHDLLDPKPGLEKWNGKPCPDELLDPENFAFIKGHPEMLASPYGFEPRGSSGTQISELLPGLARHADRIAVVRSMHTDQFNHAPAQLLLYTGSPRLGRPSMGSWISYGLGSENRDLPAYVVLVSGGKTPSAGKSVWGNGFL